MLPRLDQQFFGFMLCYSSHRAEGEINILASPENLKYIARGLRRSGLRKLYVTKGMIKAICCEMIASLLRYKAPDSRAFKPPNWKDCVQWFDKEMERVHQLLYHKEIEAEKRRQVMWKRTLAMMPEKYRKAWNIDVSGQSAERRYGGMKGGY